MGKRRSSSIWRSSSSSRRPMPSSDPTFQRPPGGAEAGDGRSGPERSTWGNGRAGRHAVKDIGLARRFRGGIPRHRRPHRQPGPLLHLLDRAHAGRRGRRTRGPVRRGSLPAASLVRRRDGAPHGGGVAGTSTVHHPGPDVGAALAGGRGRCGTGRDRGRVRSPLAADGDCLALCAALDPDVVLNRFDGDVDVQIRNIKWLRARDALGCSRCLGGRRSSWISCPADAHRGVGTASAPAEPRCVPSGAIRS